jgi:hypothetical protein
LSFDALAWAAKQRPGNLAAKMVLLALANYANEDGDAYPSTAAIAEFGDMNHKTATAAIDRLQELGLILDTGERRGRSKQIKVYRLALQSLPKQEASQNRKPPVFSDRDPQKRVTDTIKEPVTSEAKASSVARETKRKAIFTLPSHIPAEQWEAYVEMRVKIRKPMTDYAKRLAVKELDTLAADGWPPGAVLDQSTMNDWQGLFAIKDRKLKPQAETGSLMDQILAGKRAA